MPWTELHLPYDCGTAVLEVHTGFVGEVEAAQVAQVVVPVRAKVSSATGVFWPTLFRDVQMGDRRVEHVRLLQSGTPEGVDVVLVVDQEALRAVLTLACGDAHHHAGLAKVLRFPQRGRAQ